MKCSFISSSFWGHQDEDAWKGAIKKIPHSSQTEYPSEEEDRAAQKKLDNIMAYHLMDGTVMIYIDSQAHSNGQTYPDQGYFILSDLENASEETLMDSIRIMETECLQEEGVLYNALKKKYNTQKLKNELVTGHVKCLAKSLRKNAETILRLINER